MSNLSGDPFARSNCLIKHARDYRGQLQYERDKFFERLHRHIINATCWTLAILAECHCRRHTCCISSGTNSAEVT